MFMIAKTADESSTNRVRNTRKAVPGRLGGVMTLPLTTFIAPARAPNLDNMIRGRLAQDVWQLYVFLIGTSNPSGVNGHCCRQRSAQCSPVGLEGI